jgi:putative DNA methylase
LLEPLFGLAPPDWTEKQPDQAVLDLLSRSPAPGTEDAEEAEIEDGDADEAEDEEAEDEEEE